MRNGSPDQRRSEKFANRCPRGFDPFVAKKRAFAGNAFAPAFNAFAIGGDEKDATLFSPPEAGFKKMLQRHSEFTESDGFNLHLQSESCSCCFACRHNDSNSSMVAC